MSSSSAPLLMGAARPAVNIWLWLIIVAIIFFLLILLALYWCNPATLQTSSGAFNWGRAALAALFMLVILIIVAIFIVLIMGLFADWAAARYLRR